MNAALFGEDISELDFVCYDMYTCFLLNSYSNIPDRLKYPDNLQNILKNVKVNYILLALFIDIGTNSWSFKNAIEVFNAIDNS